MNDFGSELFVEQSGMHGQQGGIATIFDHAFATAVNQNGALLRLALGMATDVDQSFDHIVESVIIVVVKHQLAPFVVQGLGAGLFICLILFHCLCKLSRWHKR